MSDEKKKRIPGNVTLYTKQLNSLNTRRSALVEKRDAIQREIDGLDATIKATENLLPKQEVEKSDAAS